MAHAPAIALLSTLALLAGLTLSQAACDQRVLVARPTVTSSGSSYASSSSSSAGSKTAGETALAGSVVLKKGSTADAVIKRVQVQIYVPGANTSAFVDASCPQGGADNVTCAYSVKLPYASSGNGPIAYVKGVVTLDDASKCVSDVLTIDPEAAARAAAAAAQKTAQAAVANAQATVAKTIAAANAILASYGLPPIDLDG